MKFLNRRRGEVLEKPNKKIFHFFETISHSVFVVILGLFFTIFISFLGVSLLFFKPIYNQVAIFSFWGIICFSWSYKFFLKRNGKYLRNLTYDSFLLSKRKLISWTFYTFNFYFLFVWFSLIVLGSTNGFNIEFPTDDHVSAFIVTDASSTKILGFVLLCVHMFLLVLIKIIVYYWDRMFAFAAREFERRRKALEVVRNKANVS